MGKKGEGSGGKGGGKWGGKGGGKWGERGRELGMGYPPVHPLLKRKIKDNNACSMLCFTLLKSIDDVNVCKTKYLVFLL